MRNPPYEALTGSAHRRGHPAPPNEDAGESTGPERKCILSGRVAAREALIRLAIAPEGPDGASEIHPDVQARAPGRGAWVGVSQGDLAIALAKGKLRGALARAYKGASFTIPADLPERIAAALMRGFTDRLGLEMRAGRLLVGSDRIAEQARGGLVHWLAHASDAAPDGSRKLDQAWRVGREAEGSGTCGVTLPLDRAALSVALGRDNVVHLALTDAAAAARLDAGLQRLLHYLGHQAPPDGSADAKNSGTHAASAVRAETTI